MNSPVGEASTPPPKNNNKENPTESITENADKPKAWSAQQKEKNVQEDLEQEIEDKQATSGKPQKASSPTCKPIATERPNIELLNHRINAQIQYMKDHVLIGKFIGFWLTEKALQGWIISKWKPKGHVTLQFGPKGFFTATFNYLEDRNQVLDGGPYFFNAASLYLRDWVERFNPDKEDFS